jgi:hypothetical protein
VKIGEERVDRAQGRPVILRGGDPPRVLRGDPGRGLVAAAAERVGERKLRIDKQQLASSSRSLSAASASSCDVLGSIRKLPKASAMIVE